MRGVAKQDLSAVQNISSQSSRPLEVDVTEQTSGLIVLPSVSVSGTIQRGPIFYSLPVLIKRSYGLIDALSYC